MAPKAQKTLKAMKKPAAASSSSSSSNTTRRFTLIVEDGDGARPSLALDVQASDTIDNVKDKIANEWGAGLYALYRGDSFLATNHSLGWPGLGDGDSIEAVA